MDDTVVFASKLRRAKEKMKQRKRNERKRGGTTAYVSDIEKTIHMKATQRPNEERLNFSSAAEESNEPVRVKILEGISHAFFQMVN